MLQRQTSFDSGILRQDYGIIRDFIDHHQSPLIGNPRMTPVSFVNATELCEVCRFGHQLGNAFTETNRTETGLLTESTELKTGLITVSDQTVWAVHSCNSWIVSDFFLKIYTRGNISLYILPSEMRQ